MFDRTIDRFDPVRNYILTGIDWHLWVPLGAILSFAVARRQFENIAALNSLGNHVAKVMLCDMAKTALLSHIFATSLFRGSVEPLRMHPRELAGSDNIFSYLSSSRLLIGAFLSF